MQRFRSSVSLKAAKLSFRRKKKVEGEEVNKEGEEEKENMDEKVEVTEEEGSLQPQPVIRSPNRSLEERDTKRRRVEESSSDVKEGVCPLKVKGAEEAPPLASKFGRYLVQEVLVHLTEKRLVLKQEGQEVLNTAETDPT